VPGGVFTSERVRPYLAASGRPISFSYSLWHVEIERRRFLGGSIRAGGHTVRHIVFSDGDLVPGGGIFPHLGDEITKKGVEIGFPGAFSRRRKKGLNRPNWTADLLLIWPLARGGHKEAVFWGVRSGHRDTRSGILYSPTEDFPGEGAWQAKTCKKCCTFTQFFEMCLIRGLIAEIRQNCGAVKR